MHEWEFSRNLSTWKVSVNVQSAISPRALLQILWVWLNSSLQGWDNITCVPARYSVVPLFALSPLNKNKTPFKYCQNKINFFFFNVWISVPYLAVTRESNLSLYRADLTWCRPSRGVCSLMLDSGWSVWALVENHQPLCFPGCFLGSLSSPRALLKATSVCTTLT